MRTPTAALLLSTVVLGLACGAVLAPATAAGASAGAGSPLDAGPAGVTDAPASAPTASTVTVQDDNVTRPQTIEVQVLENGDARIELRREFSIADEERREAFDEVARQFRMGQYDLGYDTFEQAAQLADATVDREMSISGNERDVDRSGETGTLVRQFTWTNFANVSDGSIDVGDAFRTDDGIWLPALYANQRLVIRAPDGYRVTDSPQGPRVRNGEDVIWSGPRTFAAEDLRVSFGEEPESNLGTYLLLAAIGLVILVGGGLLLWQEGATDRRRPSTDAAPLGGLFAGLPWPGGEAEGTGSEPAGGGGTAPEPPEEPVDPELLSDEERVEWLLERNGGRMKQSNIVKETGWSNAKVSQLLSEMAEDDRVDKLRIGRENLITLPDVDVTDEE